MVKARVREPSKDNLWYGWDEVTLCDIEGNEIDYIPLSKWVEALAVDDDLGLYVLMDGVGRLFTCPSIDLEFEEQ